MTDLEAAAHHEARAVADAASPQAAHIHVMLADRHADLAWSLDEAMDDGRTPGDV